MRGAGRGERNISLENIYMPPESRNTVKEIQKKFGEIALDLLKYKRRG